MRYLTDGRVSIEHVPEGVMEMTCRMLQKSIQILFSQPGVEEDYRRFLEAYRKEQEGKGGT